MHSKFDDICAKLKNMKNVSKRFKTFIKFNSLLLGAEYLWVYIVYKSFNLLNTLNLSH